MAASKIVQTVTKAVKKKPGRKSKKGRPVGSKAEKAEAKELGITVPELRKRKKAKKTKGKGKKDPRTLTAKEKAAIKKQNERNRKAARLRQERFENVSQKNKRNQKKSKIETPNRAP